ncbi:MAG: 4-hydroxyphenylpyruvate dioxygenase [Deltaproteobacteria bacterium]|nr:4-hydroxyphenylpyruvate dioxygenase [Deltaproteobacteria bacterium]
MPKILDYDHLEFFVGNAKQAAYYYRMAFGFRLTAVAGLETGVRDRASYLLEQGTIRFVLTTPLGPEHPAADHHKLHGDGVRSVALLVDDVPGMYRQTTANGAKGIQEPTELTGPDGSVQIASVATYGDTIHTFIDRSKYTGIFLPGYQPVEKDTLSRPANLQLVDHVVGNVEWHSMEKWVEYYERVFGFHKFWSVDDKQLYTEYSALRSTVVADPTERVKFPINEPAKAKRKSQIEEYVDYYRSAGVQHVAMHTENIIETVTKLRENGVEFLRIPSSYYETLEQRVGKIDEDVKTLARLGVLVDRDEYGYLLQLFTKPVEDRPTLFLEVIQRKGGRSFGLGNFKALFEAIERDQAARGNLTE